MVENNGANSIDIVVGRFLSVFPPYILDISLPDLLFFLSSRALIATDAASLVSSESIVYRVRKCQRR